VPFCALLIYQAASSVIMEFLPSWAGDANLEHAWALRVTKNDQDIDSFHITRACTVVGRSQEHADILVDHQSVSRKHAALFHGRDGRLYVMCLGSTHGTTLNLGEALSKHNAVEVHCGDVLRFGKSSRQYTASQQQTQRTDGHAEAAQEVHAARDDNSTSPGGHIKAVLLDPAGASNRRAEDEESSDDDDYGPRAASNDHSEATRSSPPRPSVNEPRHLSLGADPPSASASMQSLSLEYKVPISHEISLEGHSKGLPCLSVELTGNRVVTCSRDATLQMFDFGGMDTTHRAFRTLTPLAGISVNFIAHSATGDRFAIALSNSQPLIYNREGIELLKFCKGDMYLRDLSHTKGHTTETTCICWHPTNKDVVLSGSQDGTIRTWDLNSALHFNMLQCRDVFKVKSAQGTFARVGVLACTFSFDAKLAVAACADGSVHIWDVKLVTRAKAILRPLGKDVEVAITSVVTIPYELPADASSAYSDCPHRRSGGGLLACRAQTGEVFVYALKSILAPNAQPFRILKGCPNSSLSANIAFSPDAGILCVPTSVADGAPKGSCARLCFFHTEDANDEVESETPCLQIGIEGIRGAAYVSWLASTQQIFVATADGCAKVYFDPRISKRGAMLSSSRAPPRRSVDSIDTARIHEQAYVGGGAGKRSRVATMAPSAPPSQARVPEGSTAFQKTQFIMQGSAFANPRAQDPREALLAFPTTQPPSLLAATTIEYDEQEAKRHRAGH